MVNEGQGDRHAGQTRRPPVQLWLMVLLPASLVIAGVAVVALLGNVDVGDIMRDPASTLDAHPLVGLVSQLGVIIWWITASVCLFTYFVARGRGVARQALMFLLTAGLLTVLLAIDDQFLIHDDLASRHLGLRERHVMLVWLGLAAGWFFLNLSAIRRSEWFLLGTALVLFGASIGFDFLLQTFLDDASTIGTGFDVGLLIEDGLKFVGITVWSAYLIRYSYFALVAKMPREGPVGSERTSE